MLIIVQELMHKTFVEMEGRAPKRHEIPRPCDHFDLIAGTGTGGLIAIMLGRLRLDLDTCKDLYVRMTRRVFETDKRFAGIPFKSTMYKASKLEEVIRECVREHTVSEREGNDTLANATPMSSDTPASNPTSPESSNFPRRTLSQSSRYSGSGVSSIGQRMSSFGSLQWGDSNALLYDTRENRTKTAVTAVLKGTTVTTLLRSYDSRRETAPEVNCTIWEAGRATSAIALAFKPIQIGQSVYLDEGVGKYNPAPTILDEALQNEWPGRELGVFVSIGTGKPSRTSNQQHEWWEGFLGGTVGDFAEARRRFVAKLEACEDTHQEMLREHLDKRNVNKENYYRLNVEVGVGEFGMNEWSRLKEVSTNTRMYLAQPDAERLAQSVGAKLAKIHFAKVRHDRAERGLPVENGRGERYSWQDPWDKPLPPAAPMAVELPGDDMYYQTEGFRPGASQYEHRLSIADQKYVVVSNDYQLPQASPGSHPQTPQQKPAQHMGPGPSPPYQRPTSLHQHSSLHKSNQSYTSNGDPSPRVSHDSQQRSSPPPVPPKTPISSLPYPDPGSPQSVHRSESVQSRDDYGPRTFMNMGDLGRRLPYPDVEGPPPAVNTASKPTVFR